MYLAKKEKEKTSRTTEVAVETGTRKLGGVPVTLELPGSIAARWDVVIASHRPGCENRAYAAALGLCWPYLSRKRPYTGDVIAYGGSVIDFVVGGGADFLEMVSIAVEAYNLCMEGLVPVEGAQDFTPTQEPPAGSKPE